MKRIIGLTMVALMSVMTLMAQNFKAYEQNYTSPPNTGSGSVARKHHANWGAGINAPGNGINGPGINVNGPGWTGSGFGPNTPMWGQSPGMMTGGPWGPGAFSGPDNPPTVNFNNGISHLVAVGYNAQGVWETVPIVVEWSWNGATYDVTVLNAWNPWTQVWEDQIDLSAYQTVYVLRGVTYNWYVNLSTGTYYFNL